MARTSAYTANTATAIEYRMPVMPTAGLNLITTPNSRLNSPSNPCPFIDEYTRTALAIIPRRSFKAVAVVAALENIIAETGTVPDYVRCDNGPEFTAKKIN